MGGLDRVVVGWVGYGGEVALIWLWAGPGNAGNESPLRQKNSLILSIAKI